MRKTKFTKGPWSQSHRKTKSGGYSTQVYDSDGETICTLAWYAVPTERGFTTNRSENAQLIACAPDMYEMLERVMCNYQVLASIAGQNGIVFDEYAQDSKDTESLLKRARGE